jgi:2-keto-4-pentenoate hydratase/2-oxohepta-3-ene-1,7-dioic acid hydratase in catechol pathway
MRLAVIRHPEGTCLAAEGEGAYADLSDAVGVRLDDVGDLCELLAADPGARAKLEAADALPPKWDAGEVTLLAPVRRPTKVVCIGLNYLDHCRETGTPVPATPIVFAKFPSCLIGPGDTVNLHPATTSEADWEAELAAVIGERCGPCLPPGPGVIFGYTIANDISARDLQRDDGQWTRAKSLDTFCPVGPAVVTADEIGDPQALGIGLKVNGEPQQASSTAEMIFPVAELISRLAAEMTLLPGDLLLTGTPHGTGGFQRPPRFLRPGDVMEAWIERIGSLINPTGGSGLHLRQDAEASPTGSPAPGPRAISH